MLNIRKVVKPWQEAGSLNANVNLYGFVAEGVFITKTGDLGITLRCTGVDHESLDSDEQQYAVRRLESAHKAFGEGVHIYQYLLKTNRPEIPFAHYGDEVIDTAIDQRREFSRRSAIVFTRSRLFMSSCSKGRGRRPACSPL